MVKPERPMNGTSSLSQPPVMGWMGPWTKLYGCYQVGRNNSGVDWTSANTSTVVFVYLFREEENKSTLSESLLLPLRLTYDEGTQFFALKSTYTRGTCVGFFSPGLQFAGPTNGGDDVEEKENDERVRGWGRGRKEEGKKEKIACKRLYRTYKGGKVCYRRSCQLMIEKFCCQRSQGFL